MEEKLYTGKEINLLLGTSTEEWACKGKDLLNRASNAGLILEVAFQSPGFPSLYRILKNDFYIEGEEWQPNIFDPIYEVSSLGRYRNASNKKLITGWKRPDGYIRINLRRDDGTYTSIALHRVVYFSFHPELFKQHQEWTIDHIDGKRDNNQLSNLRPLSMAKNIQSKLLNREKPQEILTQLILKYGYEETINKLQVLLKGGDEHEQTNQRFVKTTIRRDD